MTPMRHWYRYPALAFVCAVGLDSAAQVAPAKSQTPPVSLTASDGTGLQIVSFKANAVVEDPLAFTELHLTFKNPEARVLEGQFEITLPPSAAVSRFAMKQAWGWQEGEVVELQAAREAYEDFLHRRQDPALLEKASGNQFHARVFPIAASSEKEIIISYSQELPKTSDPYRLFLKGLPTLNQLDIRVLTGKREIGEAATSLGGSTVSRQSIEVSKSHFKPDRDLVVPLQLPDGGNRLGIRHENLVVARIEPVTGAAPDPIESVAILVDTSASRALGFGDEVRMVGELVAQIAKPNPKAPVRVIAFDVDAESIFDGAAQDFGSREAQRLLARRALGGSDLTRAFAAVAGGKRVARVVVVSDGVATFGKTDGKDLKAAVKALAATGVVRLDAVGVGGIRDDAALKEIVTAGLQHDGVVLDGASPTAEIVRRLTSATSSNIQVAVAGARWVWPTRLDGVQSGDQILVYADLPASKPFDISLTGAHAGKHPVKLVEVSEPLLERAWINARIARIAHQRETTAANDEDLREALKKQIVALSTKYRVLCDFTGLLVLETEADYARFHIDRRALSDILVVGAGGVELMHRRELAIHEAQRPVTNDFVRNTPVRGRTYDGVMSAAPGAPSEGAAKASANGAEMRPPSVTASPAPRRGKHDSLDDLLDDSRGSQTSRAPSTPPQSVPAPEPMPPSRASEAEKPVNPYTGKMNEVMTELKGRNTNDALKTALAWRDGDAGDVLALVALGEAYEALGRRRDAARAYSSIVDLFPSRADMRRFAGERLERLGQDGLTLAIDTFEKARAQRPDHPASHRLLAFALLRQNNLAEAFDALAEGVRRSYPEGRFAGVDQILREDLGLIAAVWLHKEPTRRDEISKRLERAGAQLDTRRSLRFVLNWETDANDVDFHIFDGKQNHAYYQQKQLATGGGLYADVTTGYGPECFTILDKPAAYPYKLQAHYYSRGPMGYGMGKLEIIEHDGEGNLRFEERPFVIMQDHAFVDLGTVQGPLAMK
jgi:tetratricopeptide (TPR) repeat protein